MCTVKMLAIQDSKQNLLCFQILTQPKQSSSLRKWGVHTAKT